MQGFGLGPRQFRVNPTDVGDRSVWTDTPEDKLQKVRTSWSENARPGDGKQWSQCLQLVIWLLCERRWMQMIEDTQVKTFWIPAEYVNKNKSLKQ